MIGVVPQFLGRYRFMSNFYKPAQVVIEGMTFPTSEHAFQALKSDNRNTRKLIRDLPTAKQAKIAGRGIKLRPNWEQIKKQVMYDVVLKKFTGNPYLLDKLLKSEGLELQEGNWWHDGFWGMCSCGDCPTGQNWLGKILMKIRNEVIQVYVGGELVKRVDLVKLEGIRGPYEG